LFAAQHTHRLGSKEIVAALTADPISVNLRIDPCVVVR
jgi:hypothetical protein